MEPIPITKAQVLAMWNTVQTFGPDAEIEIVESRRDGEILMAAESPFGEAIYRFPAAGGRERIDSRAGGPEPRVETPHSSVVSREDTAETPRGSS